MPSTCEFYNSSAMFVTRARRGVKRDPAGGDSRLAIREARYGGLAFLRCRPGIVWPNGRTNREPTNLLQRRRGGAGARPAASREAAADCPKAKVTRVRIYRPPNLNPLFNQSNMVVTVETNIGITGIGEGGAKDTLEQCAGTLIGQNPFQTEALWQEAYIAWFYPPGREKAHALGALDLALWDIKGKALGLPVHELLGGIGARLLRVLRHRRRHAGRHAARRAVEPEGARARDDGGRLSRVPHGARPMCRSAASTTRGRWSARSSRTARTCAKASGPTATGASTFTSAST